LRFGIRNMTVGFDFPKVYKITDHCLVGLPGLLSDSQTLYAFWLCLQICRGVVFQRFPRPSPFALRLHSFCDCAQS
jgi:hypothetical protein